MLTSRSGSLNICVRSFKILRLWNLFRATPKFDLEELHHLNAKILHAMPLAAVAPHLKALGIDDVDAALWEAVRANLTKLDDVRLWQTVTRGPLAPVIAEPAFVAEAAALLPQGAWDHDTWSQWTNAVKQKTGRKGKDLFMPLRLALTAVDHGPEMKQLLPLIGRPRAEARLAGRSA